MKARRMKASEAYLSAAQLVDSCKWEVASCLAIDDALRCRGPWSDAALEYQYVFAPQIGRLDLWGREWGEEQEAKECRVLALLLMHHIATDQEAREACHRLEEE